MGALVHRCAAAGGESRLGRELIETAYTLKQITDAGVAVWFYLEDRRRTLDNATNKVMLSLSTFAAKMEREKSRQRTHVNTTCKRLLLAHAFDALGCKVVGLRTDTFNLRSQRAIEALGAKRDGVIRHFGLRRDGTARDSVMYSILASEWPDVRRHLDLRLARHDREG